MDKETGLVNNWFREWSRMLDLCTTGSENGLGCWTCEQQVQRVDKDARLVYNRFIEWIRMLDLYATGSESG